MQSVEIFFEKIVRGLYYHHYGTQLEIYVGVYCDSIYYPDMSFDEMLLSFRGYDKKHNLKWEKGHTSHDKVFRYNYNKDEERRLFNLDMTLYDDRRALAMGVY